MLHEEHKRLLASEQWAADTPINRADVDDTSITPTLSRARGYTNAYNASGSSPDRRRINQIICELQGAAITAREGIPQYDPEVDYPTLSLTAIRTLVFLCVRANGPSSEPQHPQQTGQVSWLALPGATRLPEEPTDFDFNNDVYGELVVRWRPGRDHGSPIIGYDVQYKASANDVWVPVDPLRVEYPIITIDGLAGGVRYNIRARCVSDVGESDWVETNADTENGQPLPDPPNEIIGQRPAGGLSIGLQATAGIEEVSLTWTEPDNGGYPITGYVVEWKYAGSSHQFAPSNSRLVHVTNYDVENLNSGVEYDFRVTARNVLGGGQPSNIASATPRAPATPQAQPILLAPDLSPFPIGDLSGTARWNTAANEITVPISSYEWQVDRATGTYASPFVPPTTGRKWTASGHYSTGTRVKARFRVTTSLGTTDWSPDGFTVIGGARPEPPVSGSMVLVRLGNGTYRATISVGSANGNGSPITDYSYRVVCDEGGTIGSGSTQSFVDTSDTFRQNRGTVCRLLCAARNRFGWSYWREFGSYNIPF